MPYKDPLKAKENAKQYWIKNKDKLLIKTRDWKRKHKKEISIANKIYRENNPDVQKEYYSKNKDKIIERERARYQNKKEEISLQRKEFYSQNKELILNNNRNRKYKLTNENYNLLVNNQKGKCAICFIETKLVVDHNHETGKVRGLLCGHCNKALGFIREDIKLLENIKNYLS